MIRDIWASIVDAFDDWRCWRRGWKLARHYRRTDTGPTPPTEHWGIATACRGPERFAISMIAAALRTFAEEAP